MVVHQANVAWVEPVALLSELDELGTIDGFHWGQSWSRVTRQRIDQLLESNGTADPEAMNILEQLDRQVRHLEPVIRQLAKQATLA